METETYQAAAEQTIDNARSGAEKAKRQFDKTSEQIRSKAEDAWDDVVELVKKHPAKALGITLATGVALGSLVALSKRRRYSATDQFKDIAGSGIDAWDRVKSGFSEAICNLKEALDDASQKFK